MGHTLVVPRRHAPDIWSLSADEAASVMRAVHRVATRLRDRLRPQGMNVTQSNGATAWQEVFHYHVMSFPGTAMTDSHRPGDLRRRRRRLWRTSTVELQAETAPESAPRPIPNQATSLPGASVRQESAPRTVVRGAGDGRLPRGRHVFGGGGPLPDRRVRGRAASKPDAAMRLGNPAGENGWHDAVAGVFVGSRAP